jgi:hypothetical protein
MAAFFVTNTNDSGEGSLRAAVLGANANAGEDIILFQSAVFFDNSPDTITLTSGQLIFTDSAPTFLFGQGANRLTFSGNNASRVFEVASGATVEVSDVTIANGSSNFGAGILNAGTLTLSYSQVTNNSATAFGGGIFNDQGSLVVENTTINGNSASSTGGGISNFTGTVDIINSTISGNSTSFLGGGIETIGSNSVTIRNSTITLNQGGGLYLFGEQPSVLVQNTIIAGNNEFDVSRTLNSSSTFNLIGGDPKLAPLANNGGFTLTHALLPDSPARNTGSNALIPAGASGDQRGSRFPRIISEVVDIGAFEALPVVSLIPLLNNSEEGTGGTTSYLYNLTLSALTNVPVTVTLGITNGTATPNDFAVVPLSFTFSPGSLIFAPVIKVNGDSTVEPDETFTYSILSVTNATINPSASSVVSTIRNDDAAPPVVPVVSLSPATVSQSEGNSGTTRYTFTVSLSEPTSVTVEVDLDLTGGTATFAAGDIEASQGGTFFAPGETSKQVFVDVQGDTEIEPNETFIYSIIGTTNATIAPNASSVTGTVLNDDFPPVNRDPVAVNDSATVTAYQSVKVNVLANDSDPDGDLLTLSVKTNPSHGTAIANTNNTPNDLTDDFITYIPNAGYCGLDSFTYQIADGKEGTAIATVNVTVTGANLTGTPGNDNGINNPALVGTNCADTIDGKTGNDRITGKPGNDSLTGGGGQDQFIYNRGDGKDLITDFGGVGKSDNPSAAIRAEVDTIQFQGAGLIARNLLLRQAAANLEITFEGVADTEITLQNFQLENLENLRRGNSTTAGLGNFLFNGQTSIEDDFDVFDANSTRNSLFARNTVTFLNNRDNIVSGFNNSDDVVNGQGGNDSLDGKSGNDLLRGGSGNDTLLGAAGNDYLVGGSGADRFVFNSGKKFKGSDFGVDAIADFSNSENDKIVLSKKSFRALTSPVGNSLASNEFTAINASTNNSAATLAARIVYNQGTGDLIYNENGAASGFGSGGHFATLVSRPALGITHFLIQP